MQTHSSDQMGKYITQEQHLPSHHQIVLKGMNADHLKKRAAVFGDPVLQVIDTVLKKSKYAEQAYKTCQEFYHWPVKLPLKHLLTHARSH